MLLDIMENFKTSLLIMGEGMGGILFVIIIITLVVIGISKIDQIMLSKSNRKEENDQKKDQQ